MTRSIERVCVVGAGTMGAGIAEVTAKSGITAVLHDLSAEVLAAAKVRITKSLDKALEKGKIDAEQRAAAEARVLYQTTLDDIGDADLVIEAVPELIALKKKLFEQFSAAAPNAIIASNTSSLSLTEIAARAARPDRAVGLHFFNPPAIMPLLEIVRAEQTSDETLAAAKAFAARIGKSAIVVNDSPGFATSRLGVMLGVEAIRMLETGVASAEDIDRAMELGYRHPMGPLKLTDLVGLDVRLAIAEHLMVEVGPQFTPPPLLRKLVRAGKLGQKTGEGFYRWVDGQPMPKA